MIKRRTPHNLPPGPKGIPFFGNLFQLSKGPWKEFEVWKSQYGPLVYVTVPGVSVLALNSLEAAADLLERRGHLIDDRPSLIVPAIMTRGMFLGVMHSNKLFWKMRRACLDPMTKARVVEYEPAQGRQATILTDEILKNPGNWNSIIVRSTASIGLSIVYDLPEVVTDDDPTLSRMNEFSDAFIDASSPGTYLVEIFPWMRHFPSSIAKWKKVAEETFEDGSALFQSLFRDVEDRIRDGDERPSFVGTLIRERQRHSLNDLEAAWLAGTMVAAGNETTASSLIWFMLAMIAHPEQQKKCQEELDAVVGRSRMPTFKDRENLPYLRATVRELLRWRPVAPLAIPHIAKEDVWYKGYLIPKGTFCVPNTWCINRDKTLYGNDADDFNPGRFIDANGNVTPALGDTNQEGHISYGLGPRLCVGRHMANNSLFIAIASILWAMTISPIKDEMGKLVIPDTMATDKESVLLRPLLFKCEITPRFPGAENIVSQSRELL